MFICNYTNMSNHPPDLREHFRRSILEKSEGRDFTHNSEYLLVYFQ